MIRHDINATGADVPNRVDLNQNDIVNTLRSIGASVHITNQVGHGFPDIVVGWFGRNFLFEIKNDRAQGRLTPDQIDFHERWKGSVHVIRSLQEAFAILGIK